MNEPKEPLWKAEKSLILCRDADDWRVAATCPTGTGTLGFPTEYKQACADADFIAKACNAHDDLIAFLRMFVGDEQCECSDNIDEQIWEPGGGSYTTQKLGPCRCCAARNYLIDIGERDLLVEKDDES